MAQALKFKHDALLSDFSGSLLERTIRRRLRMRFPVMISRLMDGLHDAAQPERYSRSSHGRHGLVFSVRKSGFN